MISSIRIATVGIVLATVACLNHPSLAQDAGEDKRPKIGIAEVKVGPTLAASVGQRSDKAQSMGRVVDSMDGRLIDRMHNTRKFRVIARSDLDASAPDAPQQFKISGLDYLLVTSVDDFQDFQETATFAGTGRQATKRVIRLGVVAKLYDTTTGELLESASVQLGPGDPDYDKIKNIESVRSYSTTDGRLDDDLLVKASIVMADRVSNRVVDVLFPAKVVGKMGNQVMINRGDGTGIERGQVWNVFALGDAMIDPDTGISLGAMEIEIGKVRVTDVQPLFARAEILEDNGIDRQQVLRFDARATAASASQ